MHSSLVRVQNVFGFFTSAAFAVAAAIALSVLFIPQSPSASLELKNVKVARGRPHMYSDKRQEYAHITFELDADLSSLFNYNTKQVFVWIQASYPAIDSSSTPPSEVIIWDAIIPADDAPWHENTYLHPTAKSSKSSNGSSKKKRRAAAATAKAYPAGTKPGILRLKDQKPKYQITDISGKIAERSNATLTLHWNVQPYVGLLTWTGPKGLKSKGKGKGSSSSREGGRSETFDFPGIAGSETLKKKDLETETGAEGHRLETGQAQQQAAAQKQRKKQAV